jgi:hypothetical protein
MFARALGAANEPEPANPTCRRRGRSDLLASRYGSRTLSIDFPLTSLLPSSGNAAAPECPLADPGRCPVNGPKNRAHNKR